MNVEYKTPLPEVVITLSNEEAYALKALLYKHARDKSLQKLHNKLQELTE